jgi:hypothetical protein
MLRGLRRYDYSSAKLRSCDLLPTSDVRPYCREPTATRAHDEGWMVAAGWVQENTFPLGPTLPANHGG